MKLTRLMEPLPIAAVGLAAVALFSGCKSHSQPVAYNTSSVYYTGASQTGSRSTAGTGGGQQTIDQTANETVIPLQEESLKVGTRQVDAGSVRIRKVVKTETVNQPVQIRRETLWWTFAGGCGCPEQPASATRERCTPFQENEIVIQLKTGGAGGGNANRAHRANRCAKAVHHEQQNIQRQMRREDVEVIKEGNAENVTISENLRAIVRSGLPQGVPIWFFANPGGGTSQTISDLNQFSSATDKSTLTGSNVKFRCEGAEGIRETT